MADALVSIVVSNYNYERFLPAAIDSALSQTYPGIEVVVVDDGSTDRSWQIVTSYGDRIRAVAQPNSGQAAALNAGFAASRGEIVMFLDADDVLAPDAVRRVVDAFERGCAKVQFRLECCDEDLNSLSRTEPTSALEMPSGDLSATVLAKAGYPSPPTSGNAFSRECLEQILPIPADAYRLCADAYLILLSPLHGRVVSLDEVLGKYRLHGKNNWSSETASTARLRRMLQYDELRGGLLVEHARKIGRDAKGDPMRNNPVHLATRLASYRMDRESHPYPTDTRWALLRRGLAILWAGSSGRLGGKASMTVWFLVVGTLPLPIARLAVSWLFVPTSRPSLYKWLRALFGRFSSHSNGRPRPIDVTRTEP